MKCGVLAIQGAVSEHIETLKKILDFEKKGSVVIVRKKENLEKIDALIIPGGESTTISKLIVKNVLYLDIKKRGEEGMPIMGTCAGAIILSKKVDDERVKNLDLMNIETQRNAFGRQVDSFEAPVKIKGFDKDFPAVFIRAPLIIDVWGDAEILCKIKDRIVMVKQNNLFALSFHPELTNDLRIHEYFLDFV